MSKNIMNRSMLETGCIEPDALAPWELEAFADGEEMPHIAEHLQVCGHCQAQVEMIRTTTAALQSELFRFDCPPPARLHAFFWKEASTSEMAAIAEHLSNCVDCTDEMSALGGFVGTLAEPAPNPDAKGVLKETISALPAQLRQHYYTLVEQASVVVATLVPPPSPQFAGVALRGAPTTEEQIGKQSYFYEADGYDVSLIIQSNLDGTRRLSGQVLLLESAQPTQFKLMPLTGPDVTLDGAIDGVGSFTAPTLVVGEYQLHLETEEKTIIIPTVIIT